jgi:hypothetical protein
MTVGVYLLGGLVLVLAGCAIVGGMLWRARRPMDRGAVSTQWRDDQIRGRRE